ncbi:CRISPR-associated endonuclease Cas2 [Syntrophotalea acetylenica]|jgi:CRISPR-associated protein Cas2|uniref:CRISPR-associated endonuclease Cas2 n=1 Tax=Syntrophotalea acetylenica TaxID=29542 RepID=UPI002A358A64|nr:CRISPR-associated endonuclease Cas2 [Syntrophotalea acetylenica]MDY0261385.1 CRISPR-associated endonuclease Cas2 [Syntrophotalea acetylenica]
MLAVISYDIVCNRRRARLHKFLKEFGLNTQRSVFECEIDDEGLARIRSAAWQLVDPETDSFRIYRLCARCQKQVAVSGQGLKVVSMDYMVI